MNDGRRGRIAIWALAALCLLLGALLVVTVVNSNTVLPRRGADRPDGHGTPGPTTSPSATATPAPTASATPGQGGGSGGGSGGGGTGVGGGGGSGSGGGTINQPAPAYTIAGSLAQQLHPGDTYPLDLTLTNLGGASMTALNLHVTISQVNAPNATASLPCSVSDFGAVQAPTGFSVSLAAHQSTSLSGRGIPSSQWPQISMLNTAANQDGCKGATLTLGFTGSSVTP